MIKVLITDDHRIFRSGLERIIQTTCDITVDAVAGCGEDLMALLPASEATVLLMDLSMPGTSGIDLIRQVREVRPDLPILVLTMHNEGRTAVWAFEAGAKGYATKDSEPEALLEGIRRVARGGKYLAPAMAEEVSQLSMGRNGKASPTLSQREWEILGLLARGLEINAIGQALHISPKTVSTHKMRLMRKLGLSSNVDLVHYTIRRGLVPDCTGCDNMACDGRVVLEDGAVRPG